MKSGAARGSRVSGRRPEPPDERIGADEVRAHLERILTSTGFRKSERLRRFLRTTVERTLAGDADQLKEYALGRDAFDRDSNYDPRNDSIVRVEAQRLRRKLREYYETAGKGDSVRISFRTGSYVPSFSRWPGEDEPKPRAQLDRRIVAVLPFENMSTQAEQEFFCDGITEDIINALTTIPELRVLGRASMFAFREAHPGYSGTYEDARELGERLGAGTIIEGSVRRAEQVLRISAKLIDAETRVVVWSSVFDRTLGDVFAIKDEIASAIASTLRVTLGFDPLPPVRDGAPSVDAYMLYLKGRQAWNSLDQRGYETAIDVLSRAITLYPEYALPYAALADVYTACAMWSLMRPFDAMPRAKRAAMEALRLDPRLAQAYASLAWITLFFDRERGQGLALARKAIAMEPGYPFGHFVEGTCLALLARFPEAVAAFERAMQLDPLAIRVMRGLAWTLSACGRYEEAERIVQRMREGAPESPDPHYILALIYMQQRRYGEALESLGRAHHAPQTPLGFGLEGAIRAACGDADGARRILGDLEVMPGWVDPIVGCRIHLALGETDRALDDLRRAFDERSPLALYASVDPLFEPLWSDPRFQEIVGSAPVPETTVTGPR